VRDRCDLVVTMGCGDDACPAFAGKRVIDWDLDDPKGKPIEEFRAVRDEIERRVLALLAEHGARWAREGSPADPRGARRRRALRVGGCGRPEATPS
jgi:hypothetical protein